MNYLNILATLAGVYLLVLMSPGPNFFLIIQLSTNGKRQAGVQAALGFTLGSIIWASLAIIGVASILASIGWLYNGIRLVGALYLIWFGLKILRGAISKKSDTVPENPIVKTPKNAFRTGLFTSLTNPKGGVFWTSIFATLIPPHMPLWFWGITLLLVVFLSGGWHLGLAFLFDSPKVRNFYQTLRRPIDAVCGTVLVGLGLKLCLTK